MAKTYCYKYVDEMQYFQTYCVQFLIDYILPAVTISKSNASTFLVKSARSNCCRQNKWRTNELMRFNEETGAVTAVPITANACYSRRS